MTSVGVDIELKIEKSNWTPVCLGDVVEESREVVRDTVKERIEKVVGLEHIDSESIHLRRWETLEHSTTFTKKFVKGQVLFGRRRAYLKKAALAPFNGICSGDITVLEAKKDLLPELLPFLINNDRFFDFAIKNSAGSLSPRAKFKDLSNYEFLLPPKDQQAQLAELLWAADEVVESEGKLLTGLRRAYQTALDQYMIHGVYSPKGSKVRKSKCGLVNENILVGQLKECLLEKPNYGANASAKPYFPNAPRYIRITDIDEYGNLIAEDIVTIDSSNYEDYILKKDDFLFARTGNTVGKTYLHRSENGYSVYAGYLIRFRINPKILNPKFLFYFTKSIKFDSFKREMIKVGAQPNINAEEYQSMYLPLLSVHDQKLIVGKLDAINERIKLVEERILSSKQLQKSLINQIF